MQFFVNLQIMRPTIAYLQQRIEFWTDEVFTKKVPLPEVKLSRSRRVLGRVRFRRERLLSGRYRYSDFYIEFSGVYDFDAELLDDVVLHELIHYYILYFQLHDTAPHGKLFRSMMASINRNHNRNIAITHRADGSIGRRRFYYLCICKLRDGRCCVASVRKKNIPEIERTVKRDRNIAAHQWFRSDNEFFGKIPCHETFRACYVPVEELRCQLGDGFTLF